jgi:starvation-inducible DNA-binding protein
MTTQTVDTPRQLATLTDIAEDGAQTITTALNPLIADAFALYVKTKSFHWHLAGPHFRDYHLLFDEQAEQVFASIDILAERVRKIGGTTIRGISHIAELQTIADSDELGLSEREMIHRLLDDNAHMVERQRAAHEICDRHRDVATASLLEVIIDETERRKWFLFEIWSSE